MFKTASTFPGHFPSMVKSRESRETYEFIQWVIENSVVSGSTETTMPGQTRPETVIRIWRTEEDLNYFLNKFEKIFGDAGSVEVLKGP